MRLFIGLLGYVVLFLGVVLALHFDFTIGVIVAASGVFMFWAMLPQYDNQNDRLRRYERQHQQWLRGKND
jgi:hypothetical protein